VSVAEKVPGGGQLKARTPLRADRVFSGSCGPAVTVIAPTLTSFTTRGALSKSGKGAYEHYFDVRQVGSYRGAAELCGTTHKTVKRVLERAAAGGSTPRACGGHVISTWSPGWRPPESTNLVAGSRRSGRYGSPARPGTVTARAPPPAARHRCLQPGASSVGVPRPPLMDPPGLRAVRRRAAPERAPPAVGASPGRADLPAPRPTGGR
jgi:hypothetical protein